jgi:ABC-2 type transport system permease protein
MLEPSNWRAFIALVLLTFSRHWRVRSLGWVSFGLVALTAAAIAIFTQNSVGWRIENRPNSVADINSKNTIRMSYKEYAAKRSPLYFQFPGPPEHFGIRAAVFGSYQWLMLSPDADAERFRSDRAFLSFSRWVVFGLFLSFILPLFTLAFASGSLGLEREERTLIWLTTRPLPREAVYVAKLLGVLPWCVAVSLLGFAALCVAGGEIGLRAMTVYWPSILIGSLALSTLFHLVGAIFRRPAVVGLVYVFFFETLVAGLPGSMKRLSLNYYIRSLMYNDASAITTVPETQLDVYAPLGTTSAWVVLSLIAVALTLIGMTWFARQEPRDEV